MAYDERLAERIRAQVSELPGSSEIKMFGGLCFTLRGNMLVGVVKDDLMVRLDPARHDEALAQPYARPMDFAARPMSGFVFVAPEGVKTARALRRWIDMSREYVEPMPPKKSKPSKRVAR